MELGDIGPAGIGARVNVGPIDDPTGKFVMFKYTCIAILLYYIQGLFKFVKPACQYVLVLHVMVLEPLPLNVVIYSIVLGSI